MNESPYQILGVSPTASESEIKIAYRSLALKFHPDVNSDERSTAAFIRIQNAYEDIRKGVKPSQPAYRPPPRPRQRPPRQRYQYQEEPSWNDVYGDSPPIYTRPTQTTVAVYSAQNWFDTIMNTEFETFFSRNSELKDAMQNFSWFASNRNARY